MKRRDFLNYSVKFLPLAYLLNSYELNAADRTTNSFNATLVAFLDTLIPLDETPAASQMNVDKRLLQQAKAVKNYTKLIELGCYWLDLQAQSTYKHHFASLTADKREQIVRVLESVEAGSIPGQFFSRVLSDSFRLYYSSPESWSGLGISAPPQPLGYPNHFLPDNS